MIYVIMGPTASGKSNAAHALAKYFDCPIINADAFQIYRGMDIGTNKVSKEDENYSRYHLLDIQIDIIKFWEMHTVHGKHLV